MELVFLREIASESTALFIVSLAVLGLTLLAFVFGVVAITRRIQNEVKFRHRSGLERIWGPLLLDYVAGRGDPNSLWGVVEKKDRLFFIEFLLRYAFVLRGESRERVAELSRPLLSALQRPLRHRDPMIRAQAVHMLGILGMESRPETIVDALEDPSPMVAMAAARALSMSGKPEHARHVLDALDRFEQWGTSFTASLVSSIGTPVVPDLLRILKDDTHSAHSRVVAAEALRWLGAGDAAEPAHQILRGQVDPELAAAALRILRRVGRPDHADVVRAHCYSPHEVVRLHALSALATLGTRDDAPVLAVAMADPSRWIVIRAARGLRELGATETLHRVASSEHPHAPLARQILAESA